MKKSVVLVMAMVASVSVGTRVRAAYTAVDLTPTVTTSGGVPQYTNAYGLAATVGSQGGFASYTQEGNPPDHALLWSGSAATFVDLNPAHALSSDVYGMSPARQVGDAVFSTGQTAGYWTGNAASFTALPAGGFTQTQATGAAETASGWVIVGFDGATEQALEWTESGTSAVVLTDLQSSLGAGYVQSTSRATDGKVIAGQATTSDTGAEHAVVWNVITQAASDLNGTNVDSDARGVSGNEVVGYGDDSEGDLTHALLWTFNGSSYGETDLNPALASTSEAYATNGSAQVGEAVVDDSGNAHAYVWTEPSAGEVVGVDLQSLLPSSFVTSTALGIDAAGDIVGYATDADGNTSAILWEPAAVPEPASVGVLGVVGIVLLGARRRRAISFRRRS